MLLIVAVVVDGVTFSGVGCPDEAPPPPPPQASSAKVKAMNTHRTGPEKLMQRSCRNPPCKSNSRHSGPDRGRLRPDAHQSARDPAVASPPARQSSFLGFFESDEGGFRRS